MKTAVQTLLLLSLLFVSSNAQDGGSTPEARLLMACMSERGEDPVQDVMRALEAGADINVVDKRSGQTPLMAAVLRGKDQIVHNLLANGADVTISEKDGYTPAHGAAFQGRLGVMRQLNEHGIDIIHDEHTDGFLPFHRACWGRNADHTKVVEFLLDEGVNPDIEARDGDRCIEMTKNKRTIKLLKHYGAAPSRSEEEEL
jgi:ankyrin repeat protein